MWEEENMRGRLGVVGGWGEGEERKEEENYVFPSFLDRSNV